MAENDNRPNRDEEAEFDRMIERIKEVKDIDPELLSNGPMRDLAAELSYVSLDNEIALRQQAMRELGYL